MNSDKTTANDILALTAKYLRENSVLQTTSSTETSVTNTVSKVPSNDKGKEELVDEVPAVEPILNYQKINIKASDKDNSKRQFREIKPADVVKRLSKGRNTEKQVTPLPNGANFFFENHKAYNGCHSAAWQIEQSPNSFLKATVLAFAYHLPLRLNPDHIWYAILSGFNLWTNEMGGHQKLVEKNLVNPDKKDIKIEIDLNPNWDQVVDTLGERLEDAITNKDLVKVMKASFTTTTPTINRVKNLTVASIMKEFVRISFSTMCGIPYVTLGGSPQDWEKLKVVTNALLSLADGELNWWLTKLNESLDKMIATSKGEGSEKDWLNFLNFESHSGFHGCSGWINTFFPYVRQGYNGTKMFQNKVVIDGSKGGFHGNSVNFANFPPSISEESYEWTYMDKPYKTLHVSAGLVDVIQWSDEDFALEPFIGYQIDSTSN
jgi:hypothetical protein